MVNNTVNFQCNYMIPAVCILGILLLFHIESYVGHGNIEAVIALFLLYGYVYFTIVLFEFVHSTLLLCGYENILFGKYVWHFGLNTVWAYISSDSNCSVMFTYMFYFYTCMFKFLSVYFLPYGYVLFGFGLYRYVFLYLFVYGYAY
jgi:hypothetical protein